MASMNAGLILAGQPLNALGAISDANVAAAQTNAIRDQNALRGLYQTRGADILAGDPNALNALAGIDPMAAQGVQQNMLGMDATRQNMAFSAEKMDMLRKESAAAAAEYARGLSAEQRAAEAEQIAKGISGAGFFYSKGDKAGYDAFLSSQGIDPATHPFEAFPALAAQYSGALDALNAYQDANKSPTPMSAPGKLRADLEAGLITQEDYGRETAPSGMTIETTPGGGFRYISGKQAALDEKAAKAQEREVDRAGLVSQDIGRAKELIKSSPNLTAGLLGNYLKDWAGTPAADVAALLSTVRANIGFKELNDMRQASPTGGALGQVTERELGLLQAVLGNVEQSQSAEQLTYNLERLDATFNEIINGAPAGAAGSQPPAPVGAMDDEALIQKYLGTGQ